MVGKIEIFEVAAWPNVGVGGRVVAVGDDLIARFISALAVEFVGLEALFFVECKPSLEFGEAALLRSMASFS